MNKKLIIDADTWLYKLAWFNREEENESSVYTNIINYVESILRRYDKLSNYLICLQGKNNFRYKIYPEYKAKRPTQKLDYFNFVKKTIIDNFETLIIDGVETDDVVASYMYKYPDSILMHDDKDELQVPGVHIYRNLIKYISETEAYMFLMKQVLMGDPGTDNIPGVPNIGDKKSDKLLKGHSITNLYDVVLEQYTNVYGYEKGLKEFDKNYKLVKLRHDVPI